MHIQNWYQPKKSIFWNHFFNRITGKKNEYSENILFSFGPFAIKEIGCYRVLSIFSIPIIGLYFKKSPKAYLDLFGIRLATVPTRKLSLESIQNYIHWDTHRPKPRLYINIGDLPYQDETAGIPRVAKNLLLQGALDSEIEVLPLYFERNSKHFKIAYEFLNELLGNDKYDLMDQDITIRKGDCLLNVMGCTVDIKHNLATLEFLKNEIKIYFIVHDLIPIRFQNLFKQREVDIFATWLKTTSTFDGVITISKTVLNDYKRWLIEENLSLDKSFLLNWFYLGADFSQKNQELTLEESNQLNKIVSEGDYFLQVSTVEPRKGYDQLLEAFDQLWSEGFEKNFVIVGRQGWRVKDLASQILNHPLYNKKLFWLQGVSDALLNQVYTHSYAVLFASRSEGFGLALIEGQLYNKTILARDIEIFRELGGNNILYFNGDLASLATAIKTIDPRKITTLQSKKDVLERFSWKKSYITLKNHLIDK